MIFIEEPKLIFLGQAVTKGFVRLSRAASLITFCTWLISYPHGVLARDEDWKISIGGQRGGIPEDTQTSRCTFGQRKAAVLVIIAGLCLVLFVRSQRRRPRRTVAQTALTTMLGLSLSLALLGLMWDPLGVASIDCTTASSVGPSHPASGTTTSWRSIFTVPPEADMGANILPNIYDPQAINVQDVCPGYTASGVTSTANGFMADLNLAGPACNVYGNDIANLTLVVEYQAADRVNIQIQPRYIGQENETWFVLPESIIPRPGAADNCGAANSDLEVSWTNNPTFSFSVTRKSTEDVLFTTNGTVLVYADQYIEFASSLPENYNLYGLGEVIHGFRLGNNLTSEQ